MYLFLLSKIWHHLALASFLLVADQQPHKSRLQIPAFLLVTDHTCSEKMLLRCISAPSGLPVCSIVWWRCFICPVGATFLHKIHIRAQNLYVIEYSAGVLVGHLPTRTRSKMRNDLVPTSFFLVANQRCRQSCLQILMSNWIKINSFQGQISIIFITKTEPLTHQTAGVL